MTELEKIIKGAKLTTTDTVVANYILDAENGIGIKTLSEVAAACSVSETSVIRFVKKLGYKSYSEFKGAMAQKLVEDSRNGNALVSKKLASSKKQIKESSIVRDVANGAIENITKTCAGLSETAIDNIVNILMDSRRKLIVGFRATLSCAEYLQAKMRPMIADTVLLGRSESEALQAAVDVTEKDCLLMFSFPAYSEINKALIRQAKENKARTILITDQVTAPMAQDADIVVTTSIKGLGFTNSYLAPMLIAEMILCLLNTKMDDAADARAEKMDELLQKYKLY